MAAKMVIIVSMLVGALAKKYTQISDTLVATSKKEFAPIGFHALEGKGWCVDDAGIEATARTKTLELSCPLAQSLCAKDSMCVAFACISSGNFAVLYTTTNCAFGCDRLDWIHDPKKIVAGGYDSTDAAMAAWENGVCYVSEAAIEHEKSADSSACDFELNLCGWDTPSDHKWFRASGTDPAEDTGPHAAHSGTGFALVDSSGSNKDSTFILQSPSLSNYATSSEQVLLSFWYHMMGEGCKMSLECSASPASSQTVWPTGDQVGRQPAGWTEVLVEIPKGTCRFVALTGPNDGSDMGLDDIKITKSAANRDCSFETDDLCGMWEITPGVDSPGPGWSRSNGEYPQSQTGPSQAAEGESFLYVNSRGNNSPGKTFYLKSKPFKLKEDSNLQFKYHMYGAGMGTLAVKVKKEDGSSEQLWSRSEQQQTSKAAAWLDATTDDGAFVKIPAKAEMIEFVATTNTADGDMAIDDIKFSITPMFTS